MELGPHQAHTHTQAHSRLHNTDKLNLIESENFGSAEDCVKRVNRTAHEKIAANRIFSQGLVPRIYKEASKLNSLKNRNNPVIKWAKGANRHVTDKHIQMAKGHKAVD